MSSLHWQPNTANSFIHFNKKESMFTFHFLTDRETSPFPLQQNKIKTIKCGQQLCYNVCMKELCTCGRLKAIVPAATVWWVLTVNTYLWFGVVFTVTCLQRKEKETRVMPLDDFKWLISYTWNDYTNGSLKSLLGQLEHVSCWLYSAQGLVSLTISCGLFWSHAPRC